MNYAERRRFLNRILMVSKVFTLRGSALSIQASMKSVRCRFYTVMISLSLAASIVVDLFDELVMHLLKLGFGIFLFIFGHAVFDAFFEGINRITASIAHAHFGCFAFALHCLASCLRRSSVKGRDTDADEFSPLFSGMMPSAESMMAFFDGAEHAFYPTA